MAKEYLDHSGLAYVFTKIKALISKALRTQGVETAGTGAAYTATVDGITALTAGATFVMIPHTVSTSVTATLNVNGLGAKTIRRRVSNSTATTVASANAGWLAANKPIRVTFDGTYWIADLDRPNATDIYGTVAIANGGTGATTAEQALANLGAMPLSGGTFTDDVLINQGSLRITSGQIRCSGSIGGNSVYSPGGVHTGHMEIYNATPFIDFHFGASIDVDGNKSDSDDYTTRIIENSKGALTLHGTLAQTSDRRLKENIVPLGESLVMPLSLDEEPIDIHSELFDRLQPVQYNFIDGNGKICFGLIAQDVVAAMSEVGIGEDELDLVHHNVWTEKNGEEKEMYSLSYASLVSMLIHEVQKLKAELKELK